MGRNIVDAVFRPEMAAALSIDIIMEQTSKRNGGMTPHQMGQRLADEAEALGEGDLGIVRRTLVAQAATLDQIFHHLFEFGSDEIDVPKVMERYMRLALRAQAQSMRTLLALAKLSGEPRPTSARRKEAARPPEATPKAEAAERPSSGDAPQREASPVAEAEPQAEASEEARSTFAVTVPVALRNPTGPAKGSLGQAAHRERGLVSFTDPRAASPQGGANGTLS